MIVFIFVVFISVIIFFYGIFIGVTITTTHMYRNNRLTSLEKEWYLNNIIDLLKQS